MDAEHEGKGCFPLPRAGDPKKKDPNTCFTHSIPGAQQRQEETCPSLLPAAHQQDLFSAGSSPNPATWAGSRPRYTLHFTATKFREQRFVCGQAEKVGFFLRCWLLSSLAP